MPSVCMYPDTLLIEEVTVNSKNEISGWVVNGAWSYREADGVVYAMMYESDEISEAVNSWSIQPRKIVVVREKYSWSDYNEILAKYENCEDESENLREILDVIYIEELNTRDKDIEFDDDIAF